MSELISLQAADDVPTNEIARWVARINRINFAVQENHRVSSGGEAGDGIIEWALAKKAEKGLDWQHSRDYEDVILYELKRGIGYVS